MMPARENPFRVERVLRVRYRLRDETWPALMARLAAMDYRAAIVGPHGSGKTTLLEDLAARLEAEGERCSVIRLEGSDGGWTRCPQQCVAMNGPTEQRATVGTQATARVSPRPPEPSPVGGIVFIDGADSLGWLQWRRLRRRLRHARGMVITSHRPGLLPTLIECSTDTALLADIVDDLREPATRLPERFPQALFAKHRGNLRDALRELYDLQSL